MKRVSIIVAIVVAIVALSGTGRAQTQPSAVNVATTERFWGYGAFTALFSPEWSYTAMPGFRYELDRSNSSGAAAKDLGSYMYELFTGPNYTKKIGDRLTLKGSLWYYYTGFDHTSNMWGGTDAYVYQHSIEVVPSAEYKVGRFSISDRVILHQPIFSSMYSGSSNKWGYCLIVRELLQVRFAVNDKLGIILGDEPFFGVIEDGDTSKVADGKGYQGYGYWKRGFRLNRLYAGFDYKVMPGLTVTPNYVWEYAVNNNGDHTGTNHYLYLTVSYGLKLFK